MKQTTKQRTPEQRKAACAQAVKEELRAKARGDLVAAASWAFLYNVMTKEMK